MLNALVVFLGDSELEKVTVDDLRRFHAGLEARDLSAFTVRAHLRAIKIFFRWCAEEGLLESDPSRRLKLPRAPDQEPKAISREDVERMIEAALTARDRAIVEFLADTGCRVGGLVGLRLSDLDLERGRAVVREKGQRCRTVYLRRSGRFMDLLGRSVGHARQAGNSKTDASLFTLI